MTIDLSIPNAGKHSFVSLSVQHEPCRKRTIEFFAMQIQGGYWYTTSGWCVIRPQSGNLLPNFVNTWRLLAFSRHRVLSESGTVHARGSCGL
jgi:hypothetical protein